MTVEVIGVDHVFVSVGDLGCVCSALSCAGKRRRGYPTIPTPIIIPLGAKGPTFVGCGARTLTLKSTSVQKVWR